MRRVDYAKRLAQLGMYVFPLHSYAKEPAVEDWLGVATRDFSRMEALWDTCGELFEEPNIGISMKGNLVGIDIDVKDDRPGLKSLGDLKSQGVIFPETFSQTTPSGGIHYVYSLPSGVDIRNSAQKLAPGIDVRGSRGFLVGAGSEVEKGTYASEMHAITEIHPTLLKKLLVDSSAVCNVPALNSADYGKCDQIDAFTRAKRILEKVDGAPQGSRDATAYSLAARLSDIGCDEFTAFEALSEHWAPRCDPPFPLAELETPVKNAYRYKRDPGPIAAPEFAFDPITPEEAPKKPENPILTFNKNYAFVISGGRHHIIHETKDRRGNPIVKHIQEESFHAKFASLTYEDKKGHIKQWSRKWMASKNRRHYEDYTFLPGRQADPAFYNLFRGWSVAPSSHGNSKSKEALEMWRNHTKENICNGVLEHERWVLTYLAQLIQRPWEKPLVSIVLKGGKGVGKNAWIERVGYLLGTHYRTVSSRRYVVGNFNSILENKLMLTLDEAVWSGDKLAEGPLKDLITGQTHNIEHKGKEPYEVDNFVRVIILGNERWLVPATEDERRFAVFEVGKGKQQDTQFFQKMREGMEAGGYSLLLDFLQNYDISKVDINVAPLTDALLEQKLQTSDTFTDFWIECLHTAHVGQVGHEWPDTIHVSDLRDCYTDYHRRERGARSLMESQSQIGAKLHQFCKIERVRRRIDGTPQWVYQLPPLKDCRKAMDKFMGQDIKWAKEEIDETAI